MSTYLKSAAMSLLSKTVQTFLTKYLSDVDVEGVTLPSYDGSGWGVRLSNVQLREGVQLMKVMPGKVVKKRKVKRWRKKRRMIPPKALKNKSKGDTKSKQNEKFEQERDYLLGEKLPRADRDSSEKKKEHFSRSRANSAMSASDMDIPVTVSSDYYTDDDDDINEDGSPSTSVQPTTSVFSCFVKRKAKGDGNNELSGLSIHQKHQEPTLEHDPQKTIEKAESSEPSVPIVENVRDDESMYEYYEEEEEYEEDHEYPLGLFMGENGRIGTVDVRQIGKELHIMVEDAMVTIEAIPLLPKDENIAMDESSNEGNLNAATSDGAEKESGGPTKGEDGIEAGNTTAETKDFTKKEKKEPKRDTVGDRVLADNGLARLIASIPHLFLRDICIRLVVRDEPMSQRVEEDVEDPNSTTTDGENIYSKPQSSAKDTMVEVGIDFLSVTSGEDILSNFQKEHTSEEEDLQNMNTANDSMDASNLSFEDSVSTKPPSLLKIPSNFADTSGEHKNEYLIRHIRTGRGPTAGISVQLYVPNSSLSRIVQKSTASYGDLWARQHWISSTHHHLLKCSGLDIQARIYMGTKRIDAGYSWFYGEYAEDYDEGDSMLLFGGGMVTVAPGPQVPPAPAPTAPDPTPPREPRMSRGNTPLKKSKFERIEDKVDAEKSDDESFQSQPETSMHPGVDVYHVDTNGIQSCKVPSLFHRVSRGMMLKSCKNTIQLPSEVSDSCWEEPPNSDITKESSLDSSIPMPGLALQISIRGPLEINVDRNNMEAIGLIQSLFTKPPSAKAQKESGPKKEDEPTVSAAEIVTAPSVADDVAQTTSTSTGFFSSLLYGKPEETIPEEEVPEDSFETYMQPESISVMGIYLAEAIVRVHIMREDKDDRDLSFSYWQVNTKCLTIDRQSLATPEKCFSDLKLDIGEVVLDEYKGTSQNRLVSLGVLQLHDSRDVFDSTHSESSMINDHSQNKAPWPSTACALLNIAPPTESLAYKSREGHGLQLRFISTPSSSQPDPDEVSRSMIYLRLGLTTVDSNWAIRNDIGVTISEIIKSLGRGKESKPSETENIAESEETNSDSQSASENEGKENNSLPSKSLMSYTIQVDSGNISLPPLIQVKVPLTRFSGERSSLAGFSIESELGKVDFAFGAKEPETTKSSSLLPQIAKLPESVRMHILLCLKDLSPLELALDVKKEKNSFRRIKSIDKAILKTAKKVSRRDTRSSTGKKRAKMLDSANRRERIMTEIMKLDDSELANLWSVHQRYQKKLAKKLREEGQAK